MNATEALTLAQGILADLEELPERAEDFAASVENTVQGIAEWVEERSEVTDRQVTALEKTRIAVDRWLHR